MRIFRRYTVKSFLWLCTSQWSYNLTVALPTELEAPMLGLQMLTNPVVMRFFGLQIFALVARFCRNFVGKISLSLRLLLYQLS